jgi:Uma2 family endonuclease
MDLLETRRRKFNVEEYHRMAEAGILHEDSNVELIEGEIMEKHPVGRRLFDVHEYYRMAEAGILHEDERVELIEGEIIEMSPIGGKHAACVKRLILLLIERLGRAAVVGAQDPVRLTDLTEPQPDVAVLRPREDFYAEGHPAPEDVLLLIEVSDTTLEYDRSVKVPLYARAGISEVWIVDLTGRKIEVYSRPADGAYRDIRSVEPGSSISPQALPDLVVNVDDVLG